MVNHVNTTTLIEPEPGARKAPGKAGAAPASRSNKGHPSAMPEAKNRVSKAQTAGKNGVASASRPHPICNGEVANQATSVVTEKRAAIQVRYGPALSVVELARHHRSLRDRAHVHDEERLGQSRADLPESGELEAYRAASGAHELTYEEIGAVQDQIFTRPIATLEDAPALAFRGVRATDDSDRLGKADVRRLQTRSAKIAGRLHRITKVGYDDVGYGDNHNTQSSWYIAGDAQ